MNLNAFFEHWKIAENPFKGEEARQDPVFWRLEGIDAPAAAASGIAAAADRASSAGLTVTTHPDFEKIAGGGGAVSGSEFERPSTAIVFGEKGSGKTAIRIQLADRLAAYNRSHPNAKCLLIPYDDLNPILDRFCERAPVDRRGKNPAPESPLTRFRLIDHIDAMLSLVVPRLIDPILREHKDDKGLPAALDLSAAATPSHASSQDDPRKRVRRLESGYRQDLLLLQAVYDRPERADARTRKLRRTLRLRLPLGVFVWTLIAYLGWIAPAALVYYLYEHDLLKPVPGFFTYSLLGVTTLYLAALIKRSVYDRLRYISLGHRLRKQVRILARGDASFGRSIRQLPAALVDSAILPMTSAEEPRYAMLDRLARVLRPFGYGSMMLVIDRVDEPSAIAGDPDRMKSVIWPMLNNKFLQHPGLGVKMLLPMELRHALFRESSSFFQEARLDKQNLIERLTWTGPMLYDLCNARLHACLRRNDETHARPITLLDLFGEDVTRQELADALDQMHQPRDAFKLLYQCLVEHCSSVSHDSVQYRIPRHILESVRKQQVERVKQLYKGVRPA